MFEESRAVDIIYLDRQKAFDKVPRNDSLVNYWRTVSEVAFTDGLWTGSLSGNRNVLNGVSAIWRDVRSGTTQRLFLIYVNGNDDNQRFQIVIIC